LLGGGNRRVGICHDDIHAESNQLDGKIGEPFGPSTRRPMFDNEVPSFHVTEVSEALLKCLGPWLDLLG
jgi:hypothetical protein